MPAIIEGTGFFVLLLTALAVLVIGALIPETSKRDVEAEAPRDPSAGTEDRDRVSEITRRQSGRVEPSVSGPRRPAAFWGSYYRRSAAR